MLTADAPAVLPRAPAAVALSTPQEAFSELDKDGDGHLTPGELHAALRNTGALAKAGLAAEIDPHVLEVRRTHSSKDRHPLSFCLASPVSHQAAWAPVTPALVPVAAVLCSQLDAASRHKNPSADMAQHNSQPFSTTTWPACL